MVEDFEDRSKVVYQMKEHSFDRLINEPRNVFNPYADGFSFDVYAFVSESETSFEREGKPIWMEKLTYGAASSFRELQTRIVISEVRNSKRILDRT